MATGNQLIASYATLTNQLGDAFNATATVINVSSISTFGSLTSVGDLIILNPDGSFVNTASQPTLSNTASNANGIIFDGINATIFQNKILAQTGLRVESIGASNNTDISDGNIVCEAIYAQGSVVSGILFATDYIQASNYIKSSVFKNDVDDKWYEWTNGLNTSQLTATYGYFSTINADAFNISTINADVFNFSTISTPYANISTLDAENANITNAVIPNLSTAIITSVVGISDISGLPIFYYDFLNDINVLEANTGNFQKVNASSLNGTEIIRDGNSITWFSSDSNTFTNQIDTTLGYFSTLYCSNLVPAPLYTPPLIPSAFLSENSTINLYVSTPTVLGSTSMTTTSLAYMMAQANIQIDHSGNGKHYVASYLEILDSSGSSVATGFSNITSLDSKLSSTIPTSQNLTLNLRTPTYVNPDTYQILAWATPGEDQTDIVCSRLDLIGYGTLG